MSSGPGAADLADAYRADGYVARPEVVPPGLANYLAGCLDLMAEAGRLEPDAAVAGSWSIYGDPVFDLLLRPLTPIVAEHVGAEVVPTYSFARLYTEGAELVVHTDRPACQHSVSLLLGATADEPWPLLLTDLHGTTVTVVQEPGDGLCYQGTVLPHWRTPFTGRWHGQVFLHFVEADGPFADHVFDGRPGLGLPAATKDGTP